MSGRFQNRCDWNAGLFRGYNQSQFNYHDQIPHYGWDFNYAGGTYLPHQTAGPTIPAVAPLHQPQSAAPSHQPQPAAPLHQPQPGTPLRQLQPAVPLCHPQPAAPLRHPQPAAPLHQPQPLLHHPQPPLHQPQPAALLHQPQPPLHQPQPAAPLHQPQPAALSHQPQPPLLHQPQPPLHQPQPAAPLHQPQPPLHQPQHAAPSPQSQPAAPSHRPQPAAPLHQPQPPLHQPQHAAPSPQPQPAAPLHRPQPAAPLHQPQPAALSHQPQPPPLHQPQPPLHQPQPAAPLHQPQPAAPLHQPQPPLHQPQPAAPLHQPQPPLHQPQHAAPSPQPQPAVPLHGPQPAAPLHQPQPVVSCKICEVKVGTYKNLEVHNKGRKHRRMLKLLEESERPRTSNRQIPNSEMNVAQPKTFLKSGKNGYSVKITSSEVITAKHENYLPKYIGVTSKVPADGLEGKPRDNTGAQGHCSFKRKIGQNPTVEMNNQPHAPADSNINAQTDNTGAQGRRSFKRKFSQNPTVEMNNQAHAPADSNINAQTEGASSVPAAIVVEPPKGLMASQVFTSPRLDRYCKICEVHFPKCVKLKDLEMHYNGKRHQRMLGLKRLKTSNGQIPNSQPSSVVQPRTVQKSGKKGHLSKNVSSEASTSKRKNYLQKDIGATSEVRAQGPEGKRRDNTVAQGHGFKYKIIKVAKTGQCMKTNILVRRPMESSKPDVKVLSNSVEPLVQISALPPLSGPVASQIMASKGKEHHEIQNPTAEINDQQHVPADSNVNTQTEGVSSDSAAIATVPPEGLGESHSFAPRPAVGSSFEPQIEDVLQTEVSESKVHHEIQNPIVETNNQSQSISVELDAPADSDIDSQTEDASSDSGAIATGTPKALTESHTFTLLPAVGSSFEPQNQDVLETAVPQSKVHNEIQNPILETNDQSHSISMELDDPAGSDIDCQTEDVSDDSATIAGGPASQVFEPPPAVGSSFEPQSQHILHSETEPQLSKALADCEGQNCTDEKNNQLLSSALVEYNVPSGSTANAQTADGSSEAKHEMDVLSNQSGITQPSKVAVCLTCGDKGFPETLVFCSKCQVYALHRYCLDGPVIFTDDVTWFCKDCEPMVVDSSSHDQFFLLPSGKSDSRNLAKDASQARTHPKKRMNRVKKNKQKKQNIAAKTKVLFSDSRSLSQCNNICKKENKFGKEYQPGPRDKANTSEGSAIIAVPQPILDPVWRGYLCLRDHGFGLLAHMSTLACSKVLEETRLFPEVLSVDLIQRSVVWPKSFVKCRPNEDSIALYFFPDSESVERAFDKLVDDMISSDLAIRTVVKNAELLVFPSTLLPIEYRRFQAKFYLWGVFRTLKTSSNPKDSACGGDTSVLTSP